MNSPKDLKRHEASSKTGVGIAKEACLELEGKTGKNVIYACCRRKNKQIKRFWGALHKESGRSSPSAYTSDLRYTARRFAQGAPDIKFESAAVAAFVF